VPAHSYIIIAPSRLPLISGARKILALRTMVTWLKQRRRVCRNNKAVTECTHSPRGINTLGRLIGVPGSGVAKMHKEKGIESISRKGARSQH
jgi:hypothetical protein